MSIALKDILKDKVSYKMKMKRLNEMIKDIYPDIGCPDSNTKDEVSKLDNVSDNQCVKAIGGIFKSESGHLSGHECPDKLISNGINGQSGQRNVGGSDKVRYIVADGDEINQDNGHFIGHVR